MILLVGHSLLTLVLFYAWMSKLMKFKRWIDSYNMHDVILGLYWIDSYNMNEVILGLYWIDRYNMHDVILGLYHWVIIVEIK